MKMETVSSKYYKDTRYKLHIFTLCFSAVILSIILLYEYRFIDRSELSIDYECKIGHYDCRKNKVTCSNISCSYCLSYEQQKARCSSPVTIGHVTRVDSVSVWAMFVKLIFLIFMLWSLINILHKEDNITYVDVVDQQFVDFKTGQNLDIKQQISRIIKKERNNQDPYAILPWMTMITSMIFLPIIALLNTLVSFSKPRCPGDPYYIYCPDRPDLCASEGCRGCLTFVNEKFICKPADEPSKEYITLWILTFISVAITVCYRLILNYIVDQDVQKTNKKYKEICELAEIPVVSIQKFDY